VILVPFGVGMGIGWFYGERVRSMVKARVSDGERIARDLNRTFDTLKEDVEDALAKLLAERSSKTTK
jgi:hypothetical protein